MAADERLPAGEDSTRLCGEPHHYQLGHTECLARRDGQQLKNKCPQEKKTKTTPTVVLASFESLLK